VDDSFLFIKSNIRQTAIKYKFLIGPDLQNVWVAFDPGTSGSCVAVGSAPNNIILSKNRWEQEISPSVIVFDKTSDYKQTTPTENVSSYGELAERRIKDTDRFAGYRSFKKLLGFKDEQKIIFTNSNKLSLKGRDLAALLVKGLYKDLETYVNNHPDADEYKRGEQGSKKFNPLRAVVTIPNNFTASKIQDMIYCIDNLKQFKEIRYVYEAEAVLFYYLSHYGKYNDNRSFNAPENILIFDMGGATINATIVAANKTSANYNIDFLGKIGYGIGGDTIDYCIIKFLMINLSELRGINIFDKKTKEKLIPSILQIKQEMFANYSNNRVKKFLIEPNQLSTFVNDILEIKDDDKKIIIDENRLIFQYLKSEDGAIALQKFFANIIYQNIKDAINELMELSGNVTIDKIIFSGRSTIFPMIKETVEQTLKAKKINAKRIIFDKVDKSKTVVAEGACWYGVNKNSVHLNNRKTNSSFGFMRTLSADRNDINFSTLIKMGSVFNEKDDGINFILGIEKIADNFNFDSNQVNFYQIMGKDAKAILSGKQKHKFSKVAAIQIHQPTVQVGMQVSENDVVDCKVQLNSNRVLQEHGFVTDQEISDANEEHYTWMVE
jgi:molecular chaperone DnaK (HSP70)